MFFFTCWIRTVYRWRALVLGGEAPQHQRAVHDNAAEQGVAPPRSAADAVSGPLTEALRQPSITFDQGEKAPELYIYIIYIGLGIAYIYIYPGKWGNYQYIGAYIGDLAANSLIFP